MTVELAYSLIGDRDKPMLVMSSSLGTTRTMWDSQHALQERCSLLLYDHRGHGASPAPPGPYSIEELGADLIVLLDSLDVASVSFCGLSLGGMVGLWLAAQHPDRIDRLVVMCALARLEPSSRYTDRATAVRAAGLGPIAAGIVTRWFTERYAREHPSTLRTYVDELAGMPAEGYASSCDAIATCDLRAGIHRIDAPTLLIAGAEDPFVPPPAVVLFGASFREASVAVVPGAAHLVNVEQPDLVNRLVLEHLSDEHGGQA